MHSLELNPTELTPSVLFNPDKNTFIIEGKSLQDKPSDFYNEVKEWLREYSKQPNPATFLQVRFEYYNTATARELLDIFKILETIPGAKVVWQFLEDDEDMEESGQELAHLVSVPFEFKAT